MFREMRRPGQALRREEAENLCRQVKTGVAGFIGDGGYPYTVPVNFAYEDGKIYFHCSMKGHKVDAVKNDSRASFCMIGAEDVVQEEFTTNFKSVIAFGKARIVEDAEEKRKAFGLIIEKYCPACIKEAAATAEKELHSTCVICIDVEHMTGKQAKNLMEVQ